MDRQIDVSMDEQEDEYKNEWMDRQIDMSKDEQDEYKNEQIDRQIRVRMKIGG